MKTTFWSKKKNEELFDQVKVRLISQLSNGISRVLQKCFGYFNGIVISTSFVLLFPVCPVIFYLSLNEIVLLLSGKSIIFAITV